LAEKKQRPAHLYIKKYYVMNPPSQDVPRKKFRRTRKAVKYGVYTASVLLLAYATALYFIFFVFQKTTITSPIHDTLPTYASPEDALHGKDLVTYLDKNRTQEIQPINIVIVASSSIDTYFNRLGWVQDPIFSDGSVSLGNFYSLVKEGIMPVSDLYFNGTKEDYAFQNKSHSLLKREHIRLWTLGYLQNTDAIIYAGSISYDTGVGLFDYKRFIVPLHEINPNVDASRDNFLTLCSAAKLVQQDWYDSLGVAQARATGEAADEQPFFSDGKVLILYLLP